MHPSHSARNDIEQYLIAASTCPHLFLTVMSDEYTQKPTE